MQNTRAPRVLKVRFMFASSCKRGIIHLPAPPAIEMHNAQKSFVYNKIYGLQRLSFLTLNFTKIND